MSTFGEIVEPPSRNVWEDWDENNIAGNVTQLNWDKDLDKQKSIGTLIIVEGKYLYDLVKESQNLELINSITEIKLNLYRAKSSNDYVCSLKTYDLVLSSEIVDLLSYYIKNSDEVLALITKPLAEYHSSGDHSQNCIIRRLSTKAHSKLVTNKYLRLEQPNIISGASAGAIFLREVLEQPATAIVFYTEQLENNEVNELCNLLQRFNIVVDKWKSDAILNSNLYI